MIGDPSGKSSERGLNPEELVEEWTTKIRAQLERFLDFDLCKNPARIANNYDWLGKQQIINFLRDVGKYFPISYMLSKDAVKSRLATGISYTEFSYMILQSYDFLRLNEDYGCEMQAGGSDQWGNITAGIDLIRRVSNKKAYGLTFPSLRKATEQNLERLNQEQYGRSFKDDSPVLPVLINTDDRDVSNL